MEGLRWWGRETDGLFSGRLQQSARQRWRNCQEKSIRCCVTENPTHQGIQLYTLLLRRPCGIAVPCTCRLKGHWEFQCSSTAGGTCCTTNHRYDLCHEVFALRSQDCGGTCSERMRNIAFFFFLDRVAMQGRGSLLVFNCWESPQFCQHDPGDAHIHRLPWCCEPSTSSQTFLTRSDEGEKGDTFVFTSCTDLPQGCRQVCSSWKPF